MVDIKAVHEKSRVSGEGGTEVRPFSFSFSDEELADLRRRIAATKWPDVETVPDESQGVKLGTMQKLARYWGTDYDWRKGEAKLKAVPHFITEIDGLDIHFIHVRSTRENALPMIVTHGWPGSIIEQLKIIHPLTNPTANGGSASDAFDLVIPSLPGYGFSGKPTKPGWNPPSIAKMASTITSWFPRSMLPRLRPLTFATLETPAITFVMCTYRRYPIAIITRHRSRCLALARP